MVAPKSELLGPKLLQETTAGFVTRYDRKYYSKQKAPFNLPLSYDRRIGTYLQDNWVSATYYASSPFNAQNITSVYYTQSRTDICANRAYEKFKGKVYGSAALGVDFAEARQSLAMIARSCETLWKFTRHVKRFQFELAMADLGMHLMPRGLSARKSWASNWLEFHFGWEPLIRDIYDAIGVVNNPLKTFSKAKGVCVDLYTSTVPINFGSTFNRTLITERYMYGQGGRVSAIANSTYHSLDQFGLLNPAVIAWELVPFSFVVDWFVNVGDVLSSYSDFAGITLVDTYRFLLYSVAAHGFTGINPGFTPAPGVGSMRYYGTGTYMSRAPGLALPTFSVKRLRLPSSVRGLTALSLLTQQLSRH